MISCHTAFVLQLDAAILLHQHLPPALMFLLHLIITVLLLLHPRLPAPSDIILLPSHRPDRVIGISRAIHYIFMLLSASTLILRPTSGAIVVTSTTGLPHDRRILVRAAALARPVHCVRDSHSCRRRSRSPAHKTVAALPVRLR